MRRKQRLKKYAVNSTKRTSQSQQKSDFRAEQKQNKTKNKRSYKTKVTTKLCASR